MSGLCRVHGLDRILTPLIKYNTRVKSFVFYLFHAIREIISSFSFFGIEIAQMKLDELVEDVMNLDINKESMDNNHGHSQD